GLDWTNTASTKLHATWKKGGVIVNSADLPDAEATTYTISGLTASTEYTVTITAVGATEEDEPEAVITVSTLASGSREYSFIHTIEELDAVRNALGGNYILMADLDLSSYDTGTGWTSLGDSVVRFTGIFEGNNHVIENLFVNNMTRQHNGLFGYVRGATIRNLRLASVNVTGYYCVGGLAGEANSSLISNCSAEGTVSGTYYTGGLVGYNNSSSTITRCHAAVAVTGSSHYTGGLVGENYSATITDCYAAGNVTSNGSYGGGLVGTNTSYGSIRNSFAMGNVVGNTSGSETAAGGLVGFAYTNSSIANCYATGSVSGISRYIGGILGWNWQGTITNCYATGSVSGGTNRGGVLGRNWYGPSTTACYHDSTTTGMNDATYATPYTTEQMKLQDASVVLNTDIYVGWDFVDETANGTSDIWSIDRSADDPIHGGYPYLRNNPPPAAEASSLAANIGFAVGNRPALFIALGALALGLGTLGGIALYRRRRRTA
ncbi:MAG: hypothetical protein JXA20_01820, partial [Spirochaetes bacterium]|nr:hypothetical protein [Spirochaetota bacterium]